MRFLFNWLLLKIAKQHRGIALGPRCRHGHRGPFFLLTSGPAALPHVDFVHVDAGRIMRVFVRDGCFISDKVVERSALKPMS